MGDGAARWTPALCASRSIPTLDDVLVGVHLSHGPWFAQQAPPDAGQVAIPGGQTARDPGHAFGAAGGLQASAIAKAPGAGAEEVENDLLRFLVRSRLDDTHAPPVQIRILALFPDRPLENIRST